jgi:lipid-A-disaccharide synthase
MSRYFIIAGEVSGDTHAAGLMRELRAQDAAAVFHGLGGPQMREESAQIEDWLADSAVLGLWEVLKHYGYFRRKFAEAVVKIGEGKPDAVILIDYPGFNLRVAVELRARGFTGKIIYYISPQVWAWKKGRVRTMARVLDLVICIFPFEQPFYEQSGLRAVFAGHPMVDRVHTLKKDIPREPGLVGWFPGSRANEVRRLFPVMLEASRQITQQMPAARFVVSAANESLAQMMRDHCDAVGRPEAKSWIETGTVYDLMQRVQVGAVASGTATLEAACFGLPYVLVYQVSWMTYEVGRRVVDISHLGIVNILAKREVVRELVQHGLTVESLTQEITCLLTDASRREQLEATLGEIMAGLGEGGAYQRAAKAVRMAIGDRYENQLIRSKSAKSINQIKKK